MWPSYYTSIYIVCIPLFRQIIKQNMPGVCFQSVLPYKIHYIVFDTITVHLHVLICFFPLLVPDASIVGICSGPNGQVWMSTMTKRGSTKPTFSVNKYSLQRGGHLKKVSVVSSLIIITSHLQILALYLSDFFTLVHVNLLTP